MILRVRRSEGPVAAKEVSLEISTQDAVDVPLLEELFLSVPAFLRAKLHKERQGDYAYATLWLLWPEEGK